MKIRRLALVAGVALSAVAFSPKAQAQTANVDFSGTISPTCSVNSTTNGTLSPNATSFYLSANSNFGTTGNINISCNGGTKFTITGVTDNGTSLSSGTYTANIDVISATIYDGGTVVASSDVSPSGNVTINNPPNVPGPLQGGPIVAKDYKVYLSVYNTSPSGSLRPGNYKVRVAVSLTPQ